MMNTLLNGLVWFLLLSPLILALFLVPWSVKDAKLRGKSPLLVSLAVVLFFPWGLIAWLIFRPEPMYLKFTGTGNGNRCSNRLRVCSAIGGLGCCLRVDWCLPVRQLLPRIRRCDITLPGQWCAWYSTRRLHWSLLFLTTGGPWLTPAINRVTSISGYGDSIHPRRDD